MIAVGSGPAPLPTLDPADVVGWLGAVVAYLALAIAGLAGQCNGLVRAAYLALELIELLGVEGARRMCREHSWDGLATAIDKVNAGEAAA